MYVHVSFLVIICFVSAQFDVDVAAACPCRDEHSVDQNQGHPSKLAAPGHACQSLKHLTLSACTPKRLAPIVELLRVDCFVICVRNPLSQRGSLTSLSLCENGLDEADFSSLADAMRVRWQLSFSDSAFRTHAL